MSQDIFHYDLCSESYEQFFSPATLVLLRQIKAVMLTENARSSDLKPLPWEIRFANPTSLWND